MTLLCFFGHHRSASTWTKDILLDLGKAMGWRTAIAHNTPMFENVRDRLHTLDLLAITNAKWAYSADLPPFVGLHVVRDPRDILVSAYFSHRNTHPTDQWPELIPHRAALRSVSKEAGLLLELDFRREQFADMLTWQYDSPHIYEIKMEQLTRSPAQTFNEILRFCDRLHPHSHRRYQTAHVLHNRTMTRWQHRYGRSLPRLHVRRVYGWVLAEVLNGYTFVKKSGGRKVGEVNEQHHYRNGKMGQWREHFFDELTAEFKHRYNSLLLKLGYEQNEGWQ